MLGVGGATTLSVLIGQGDKENVNKVFTLTMLLSAGFGIIVTVLGSIFLKQFAIILGATPELLTPVMDYLRPLQYIAVFYILNCTMQVIIRADFNPKLVMVAAVVANLLNIFFDWLFVAKLNMGLAGASTATAIGPCVAVIILSMHYIFRRNTMHFKLKCFSKNLFVRIVKNGIGTFILEFTSGAVIFLFNFVLLRVSTQDAVAVYAIVSNIAYVGKGIFNGISQAAQPLISVNYGAGSLARIKKSLRTALTYALSFSTIVYGLILLFPQQIISVFIIDNVSLIDMGISASIFYFTSLIFTAINTMLMYYFQSVENIRVTALISISRGFVFIVIGLLIFPNFLGETGVWITVGFAEIITLLITIPIYKKYDKLLHQKFNLIHLAD